MATLPVLTLFGAPVVPVTLNGKPALMAISTGADRSAVSEAAVKEFGLIETGTSVQVDGTTGAASLPLVQSDTLVVGRADASDFSFFEMADLRRSVPMARINGAPVVGELGMDFLRRYEVWFDLPEGQITLARPRKCTLKDVGWDSTIDQIPVSISLGGRPNVEIRLNGHKIRAMLSSASSTSTITPERLDAFGITSNMSAENHAEIIRGVNGRSVTAHRERFDRLTIGTENFSPAWLTVAPMETADAELGADFLRGVVFWLSFGQSMIYLEKGTINPFATEHPSAFRVSPQPANEPPR
ncbi:retropepsin-like aspartic protease [Acetobacter oeni]|uniref:Peptidase A2 domain-containing protein n=1 Tax=Acetobacter oeni TaxID=304077 RepID=A0A511XGR5_9PROT|nr:retropepsin-like aspartic protease [Acetobacter oeni]MBB3881686.1 putative aspartyl protease [Acetobacter oeni]GBR06019.1 hypothetical protein AA21952_1894 [Acetobacter oeni LMG 21952]GEN62144.1 hypothetical protein AOE01nite_03680 [Acetobacter oeni]